MLDALSLVGVLMLGALMLTTHLQRRGRAQAARAALASEDEAEVAAFTACLSRIAALERENALLARKLQDLEFKLSQLEGDMPFDPYRETGNNVDPKLAWAFSILDISIAMAENEAVRKKAYRKALRKAHPDHGGTSEAARDVMEAWVVIQDHYKGKH